MAKKKSLGIKGVLQKSGSSNKANIKQAHYDIPINLRDTVRQTGRNTKASVSGFAAILLSYGLQAYLDGEIDIEPFLIDHSSSPRYLYTWDFEKIDQILKDS